MSCGSAALPLLLAIIILCRQRGLYSKALSFDEAVLIAPDLALLFNASHFWVWQLNQGRLEQVDHVTSSFYLTSPPEFTWVPFTGNVTASEENFELDYGKVCVTSDNESTLYDISYESASKSLQIVRSSSSYCDSYIHSVQNSICYFTILPILQGQLPLSARYSSGSFLIDHNQYLYFIFDQKYEDIDKKRMIIIRYRLRFPDNRSANLLQTQSCIDDLKSIIELKKVTRKPLTDVKTILLLSNGTLVIFFKQHYCIGNMRNNLHCERRNTDKLFTLERNKRSVRNKRFLLGSNPKGDNKSALRQESHTRPRRQTASTTINEFRSAIMIVVVFILSVLVILAYKLILFNRNN